MKAPQPCLLRLVSAGFALVSVLACSKSDPVADNGGTAEVNSKIALCDTGALASSRLQPGSAGGPDAKGAVKCDAGYSLCRVDPQGSDNDVCGDALNCFVCTKPAGTPAPAKVPTCAAGGLGSSHLQPGTAGGPDAKSVVKCEAGYALCRIDPHGSDNDVCGDALNCYACTK
jgi:hypothetical protein